MKKLLILLLVPLFAMSQTNPNREYWQTNKWTAKKGMNAEFEAGVAKKTQKFNNTKETSFCHLPNHHRCRSREIYESNG